MRRLIDDYKAEFRHMRENAPYVPWLAVAVAVVFLIAAAVE